MEGNVMKSPIIKLGTTYIYKDDVVALFAVLVLFFVGALMVRIGNDMDAEVERQRVIEMGEIAHDEAVNREVTRK
jgi:hypothetical protein